jgi:high affinity Mn2+ porin
LRLRLLILGTVLFLPVAAGAAFAQARDGAASSPSADAQSGDPATTVFEHPTSTPWSVSGQVNVIAQGHGSFPAKYSGPNSLRSTSESAVSNLLTLYSGLQLNSTTEAILDVESAGGHGISAALGLAGFTNLDVVRSPDLGQTPYLARLMIRKVIRLSPENVEAERSGLSLATELPARRLELRFGKFSLVDFFDLNAVGSDSHLQFMNWTVDNNGAYDYAANTRGYTWGAVGEYVDRGWSLRFAEGLMPKVANGPNLDADVFRAHAENLELEIRRGLVPHREGTIRLLWYRNTADMGSYRDAIHAFEAREASHLSVPDITLSRRQGRIKYGFGVNLEQALTTQVRAYGRWSWNNGRTESFAYTEVDQSFSFGADLRGDAWRRKLDKVGGAFVVNGICGDHREYLRQGGKGFLLGDGSLTYGREHILEGYYNAHLWRGFYISPDLQYITNPGYNRDRGPVLVGSLRLHVDI